MNYLEYIDADPEIMLGKPKIKGTRLTVELILRKISDGFSFDDIIEIYPTLTHEMILATVSYATAVVESEEVIKAA